MRRPAARATQSVAPPPAKPRRGRPPKLQAASSESLELAVSVDNQQRKMVDEYGELDRRMQVNAPDVARYDVLKRAIKSWFDRMPPDADGIVEGAVYRLHLSARERERRVRSMRDLVDTIGLDAVLDLAVIPITKLENAVGKSRVENLIIEQRTGSRRIRSVPKLPTVPPR